MITVFRILFFLLSTFGIWQFIHRHSDVNIYFIPGLTVAIQVTILICGGILNLLPEVSYAVYSTGILFFFYFLFRNRKSLIHEYTLPGFFFLAGAFIITAILLKDECFVRTDNYSHWGLVVKAMLKTDRFPTFQDQIIKFKEYPLGSSCFIYFFSKWVGQSEPIWMLAQAYIMLVNIVPLFIFGEKRPVITTIIVTVITGFVFTYNILPRDILVDTLLPLTGMGGLLYAYFYCRDLKKTGIMEFFFTVFYMIQVIQIKNSGVFFYGIICLWIFANIRRDKRFFVRLSCGLLPLSTLLIWHKHCAYVFEEAQTTKHAMTVNNLSAVFGEKTPDEIKHITESLLHFSATYEDTWLTMLLIVIVGIIAFLISKEEGIRYGKTAIFFILLYVFYCIGMLIMYLLSMPTDEAMKLASNTRYIKSIIIAIIYLVGAYIVKYSTTITVKDNKGNSFIKAFIILLCIGGTIGSLIYTTYRNYPKKVSQSVISRQLVENAQAKYNIPEGAYCCILISNNDNRVHMAYMGKYLFYSPKTTAVLIEKPDDIKRIRTDYIIRLDQENSIIDEWIRDNYPEQAGNEVIIRQ